MVNGLVSVVLSIYNVEKYIDRCIESVVNQSYKNLEIILVDDGSTDSCPKICDEWGKKDGRVKVVHKENQGLGMARNTGIENATGEYICFFDSDDYIEKDALEKCFNAAKSENADTVYFGMKNIDKNGLEKSEIVPPETGKLLYEGDEVLKDFLPDLIAPDPKGDGKIKYRMSAWTEMYSMKLIQDSSWRFTSEREIISEDVYSLLSLYKNVKRVVIVPEALYCYCENDSSLTRSYREDRYDRIKHFYNESVNLVSELGYDEEIVHRLSKPYLAFTIAALKQETAVDREKKETMSRIKKIVNDPLLQKVLKQNSGDAVSTARKILFLTMRSKCIFLCYRLLKAKT